MNNHDCHNEHQLNDNETTSRRRFLRGAAAAAGGLVLGAQLTSRAEETIPAPSTPATVDSTAGGEMQIPLPSKVLEKVGGFAVVENADEKIIVARTGAATIAACSAVCTHRGGILEYDEDRGQFYCTRHGARFETTGKVAKGPAEKDLKAFQTRAVLGLSLVAQDRAPD